MVLLALIFWNKYSSIKLHQSYQYALMDSVTNSVLSDYQEHLIKLRFSVDDFQHAHYRQIQKLSALGPLAKEADYMVLLKSLRGSIPDSRLFSIIDEKGHGILKHITGDFLPDCQEEIDHTIDEGNQEKLFLHRNKTSVHFDILEPLVTRQDKNWFFFVAFNTTVFQELLTKYQLPYQQLFLLRKDNIGKIELSTEDDVTANQVSEMTMQEQEKETFDFVKDIPNTRWQLAIRTSPDYTTNAIKSEVFNALILWLVTSGFIFIFYRALKSRIFSQQIIEKKLAFESSHDSLTGTINRATFEKELVQAFSFGLMRDDKKYVGCALLVDIDNFQLINNTYGYSEGDKCLNQLSHWLSDFLPDEAIVSRLGNDEFAILLTGLLHDDAESYADTLRENIQQLRFSEFSDDLELTASIGVFNFDHTYADVGSVLNSLSQATKLAKKKGRNRVQLYQSTDIALQQHASEMSAIKDVRLALAKNQFVLHRQRIFGLQESISQNKYEVLLRLKNSQGEIIGPNVFIPASEKYGLIKEVDRWVINSTLRAIHENEAELDTQYSINISGVTLAEQDIFEYVSQLLISYNINPKRIGFEVTETYAITHLDSAITFISKMTELGCEFSLDDFGIGLSSFSYLQQIPVQHIKIDGSFIKDICNTPINKVFVKSIHNVAVEMGKMTIAEFVEDEETLQYLTSIGVTMAQGFHCHKPEYWYEIS